MRTGTRAGTPADPLRSALDRPHRLSSSQAGELVPCPFVVSFYDAFISPNDGNVSIVMEYMDGGSLQDIVDTGGCNAESVLSNISYRVLSGLAFIHEHHQVARRVASRCVTDSDERTAHRSEQR